MDAVTFLSIYFRAKNIYLYSSKIFNVFISSLSWCKLDFMSSIKLLYYFELISWKVFYKSFNLYELWKRHI